MSIETCYANKAASAIFASTDFDVPMRFIQLGDGHYPSMFSTEYGDIGNVIVNVYGNPDAVTIETQVTYNHPLCNHPLGSSEIKLLASESNDTFVNATKLALASLERYVAKGIKAVNYLYDDVIARHHDGYELTEDLSLDGKTRAEVLDYLLTHEVHKDNPVEYRRKDKYDNVELNDVDPNKVFAVYNFFLDVLWDDDLYRCDSDELYSVRITDIRDAVNWALKTAKSTQTVDSDTVKAALMTASLDSTHDIFECKGVFSDSVRVPIGILNLIACHKMHK